MLRSVRLAQIAGRRFNSSVVSGGAKGKASNGRQPKDSSISDEKSAKMNEMISQISALTEAANAQTANAHTKSVPNPYAVEQESEPSVFQEEKKVTKVVEEEPLTLQEEVTKGMEDLYEFVFQGDDVVSQGNEFGEELEAQEDVPIDWNSDGFSNVDVNKGNSIGATSINETNGRTKNSRKARFELAQGNFANKEFSINEFLDFYDNGHVVSVNEDTFVEDLVDSHMKKGYSNEAAPIYLNDTYAEMINAYSVRQDIKTFKKMKALKKLGFEAPLLSSEEEDSNTPFAIEKARIDRILKTGQEANLNHADTVVRMMSHDHISTDKEDSTYRLTNIPTKEKLDLNSPKSAHTEKSRVLRALDQYLYKKSGAHLDDITDNESAYRTHFTKFEVYKNPDLTTSTQNYPYTSRTVSASTSIVAPKVVAVDELKTDDFGKVIESVVYGVRDEIPLPKRNEDGSNVSEIAFINALNHNTQIKVDSLHLQLQKAIGKDGKVDFQGLPQSATQATHEEYMAERETYLAESIEKEKKLREERSEQEAAKWKEIASI